MNDMSDSHEKVHMDMSQSIMIMMCSRSRVGWGTSLRRREDRWKYVPEEGYPGGGGGECPGGGEMYVPEEVGDTWRYVPRRLKVEVLEEVGGMKVCPKEVEGGGMCWRRWKVSGGMSRRSWEV